ncbi:MAG: heme-binding protein [Planctomycetota bacterium]
MLGPLLSLIASSILMTPDAPAQAAPEVVAVETDKGIIWTCVVDGVRLQTGDVLPEGYPPPTAPGMIEVKEMPAVRRAEVSGVGSARRGMSTSFNPLFRHITSRGIAMTAPVEVDIREMSTEDPEGEAFTAAFLYRSDDLGPTGDAENGVQVVDLPAMTVVSIGIRGAYLSKHWSEPLAELEAWLNSNSSDWRPVGDPRFCGYNAPFIPVWRMWSEIQIPIERVDPDNATAETVESES